LLQREIVAYAATGNVSAPILDIELSSFNTPVEILCEIVVTTCYGRSSVQYGLKLREWVKLGQKFALD